MTANPTEVMTEQEKKLRDYIADGMNGGSPLKLSSEQRQTVVHIIDRLSDQSISLRSSRDEAVKELDRPIEGYLDAERTIGLKWSRRGDYAAKFAVMMLSQKCELEAKVARLKNAAKWMMEDRDAARAEVSRLSGELASRPAKELDIRLEPQQQRVIDNLRNWYKTSALSQASSADALSAPAKEGVVLYRWPISPHITAILGDQAKVFKYGNWRDWDGVFTGAMETNHQPQDRLSNSEAAEFLSKHGNPFSPAPVAGETRTCAICGQSGRDMRELTSTETFSTLLGTVGISAYAWVCKSHRSAPVAAPASAVSPASEEKDAMGKLVVCPACNGKGTRNCVLGCLTCGQCNGKGKIDPAQDQGFVAQVLRSLKPDAVYCECDLRNRAWNPASGKCESCGRKYASEGKDVKGENMVVWAHPDEGCYWVCGLPEGELFVRDSRIYTTGAGGEASSHKSYPGAVGTVDKNLQRNILIWFWPLYEKWKAEQVSPTPAPAPSEDYPGVRVYQSQDKTGTWVVRQDLKELRSKVERIGAAKGDHSAPSTDHLPPPFPNRSAYVEALEKRVERMQAVVDAASLLTDAIEDLAGKGCMTASVTTKTPMVNEASMTVRTIADDRLFVEVLRNANLVKTKLDAAREGKR